MAIPYVPYCGAPPTPSSLAWNFDPVLLAALAAGFTLYVRRARRDSFDRRTFVYGAAGSLMLAAAFVSPLCNLGVALFSARAAQHMALVMIVAPLLVAGRADELLAPARSLIGAPAAAAAALVFAVTLWVWHWPPAYDATFASDGAYWAMELSLLGTGLLLWRVLLREVGADGLWRALAASAFTAMQMAALGALLAFTPRAIYAPHLFTANAFGLSPLADQQLGAVLMWAPFGLVLAAHFLWATASALGERERCAGTA